MGNAHDNVLISCRVSVNPDIRIVHPVEVAQP
jgi:hypothetical protein